MGQVLLPPFQVCSAQPCPLSLAGSLAGSITLASTFLYVHTQPPFSPSSPATGIGLFMLQCLAVNEACVLCSKHKQLRNSSSRPTAALGDTNKCGTIKSLEITLQLSMTLSQVFGPLCLRLYRWYVQHAMRRCYNATHGTTMPFLVVSVVASALLSISSSLLKRCFSVHLSLCFCVTNQDCSTHSRTYIHNTRVHTHNHLMSNSRVD